MDNEMSHDVETFICKENTHLQYTPPGIHRTNLAEREILYVEESLPLQQCWASKNLPNRKLVLFHQSNRLHPQHAMTVLAKSCSIGVRGTHRVLF